MLSDALHRARTTRLTEGDEIDLHAALGDLLAGIGLSPADCGGRIEFSGADPILPSPLATASAAALGLVAKSVAMAALWRDRTGQGQDIAMDLRVAPHRLCPFYDRKWELLGGYPQGNDFDRGTSLVYTRFYRTADDRWVLPQGHYPRTRNATLALLKTYDAPDAVAAAIRRWPAADLEVAGAEAGVVMPMVRSTAEFMAEPQFTDVLDRLSLIEVQRIGDSEPEALSPAPEQPLTGVRALGMGHVIAGGGIGRTMALHGADVLNVWRPTAYESPVVYHTAQFGVRSVRLDPYRDEALVVLRGLAAGADVFYANRRPGVLDRIGFTPAELAHLRPGIVFATVSLHGEAGPRFGRPGFDQTAASVVGMMTAEGTEQQPRLPLITVVNDWIVPWLATAGIVAALRRRAVEGGSYRVHVSLTRVALWILSLGLFDKQYAHAVAGHDERHAYLDPETFLDDGPTGLYQGVTDQVRMSKTPGRYRFGLLPMGSSRPQWCP